MARTKRNGLRTWIRRALALVVCGLLGGWIVTSVVNASDSDEWASAQEIDAARTALKDLATFEEMRGTSVMLLDEIRRTLDDDVGTTDWINDSVRRDVGGCSPAESEVSGAFSEATRSRGALATLTDHTDRILEIIEAVAGRHGYKPATRFVDGVGDQYFYLSTDRGGRISVVFGELLDIRVTSDCYLTEAAMVEATQ